MFTICHLTFTDCIYEQGGRYRGGGHIMTIQMGKTPQTFRRSFADLSRNFPTAATCWCAGRVCTTLSCISGFYKYFKLLYKCYTILIIIYMNIKFHFTNFWKCLLQDIFLLQCCPSNLDCLLWLVDIYETFHWMPNWKLHKNEQQHVDESVVEWRGVASEGREQVRCRQVDEEWQTNWA